MRAVIVTVMMLLGALGADGCSVTDCSSAAPFGNNTSSASAGNLG